MIKRFESFQKLEFVDHLDNIINDLYKSVEIIKHSGRRNANYVQSPGNYQVQKHTRWSFQEMVIIFILTLLTQYISGLIKFL